MVDTNILGLTFPTYESASLRSAENNPKFVDDSTDKEVFHLYSARNVIPLLSPLCRLLWILLSPYFILLTTAFIFWGIFADIYSVSMMTIAFISMTNIAGYFWYKPSCINGRNGFNSVGATTKPGLYHSSSLAMTNLISKCPLLSSSSILRGSLPNLSSTLWMITGDMRTLFPFLANKPKNIAYLRRWVSS